MRGDASRHELVAPPNLERVLDLLADPQGGYRVFAGGTDLMVAFERGLLKDTRLVSIWHLVELRGIATTNDYLVIGALSTYTELLESPMVAEHAPVLAIAARETAALAIRNRGTVGGNIANASPAADLPPALLAHSAEVELISKGKSRWVDYATFHTGYKTTVMRPDEIISRVRIPLVGSMRHTYRKVGTRNAQAISKVCMAATICDRDVRVAFGSVAPTVVRARTIEREVTSSLLYGKIPRDDVMRIAALGVAEATPIDDIRSTAEYRRRVTANLLREWLETLVT